MWFKQWENSSVCVLLEHILCAINFHVYCVSQLTNITRNFEINRTYSFNYNPLTYKILS
jgi:hypothetical protein